MKIALGPILWVVVLFSTFTTKAQDFASPTEGCAPLTGVQFSNPYPDATSISWSFGNGISSNLTDPIVTYVNPGVYTATYTATVNGTEITESLVITVFESPTAAFSVFPAAVCLGNEVVFTDESEGTDNAEIVNHEWDYGNGTTGNFGPNPSFTYGNTGIFQVTLIVTDENGCTASSTQSNAVTVSAPPNLNIVSDPDPVLACEPPLTVSFTNQSSSNSPTDNSLTYTWDFGNGETANSANPLPVVYSEEGLYDISITATDNVGCTSAQSIPVSVQQPEAEISVAGAEGDVVCTDVEVIVEGTQGGIFNYGDGTITTNPNHSYNNEGDYTITYTVSADGCSTESSADVSVEVPTGVIVAEPEFSCNNPAEFTFSLDSESDIETYDWSVTNSSINSNDEEPTFLLEVPEASEYAEENDLSFMVEVFFTSSSGCPGFAEGGSYSVSLPVAIMYPDATQGCAPLEVEFDNESTYEFLENVISYEWHYGDGTVETVNDTSNVIHTYEEAGDYEAFVIMETIEGCVDTSFFHFIGVGEEINPTFEISSTTICPNEPITLTNTSAQSDLIDAYSYSGDLNTISSCFGEPSPTVIFDDFAGVTEITQSVEYNGCISTSTQTITVEGPVAKIEYGCNCDTPYDFDFTAEVYDADYWTWSFGDGTEIANSNASLISHTYENTGDYTVELTAFNEGNSCPSFSTSTLVKVRDLAAEISITEKFCSTDTITAFAINTQDVASSNDNCYRNYLWDFGDSTLPVKTYIDSVSHVFQTGGDHTITLSVKDDNECVFSTTEEIEVYDIIPEIEFEADGACIPMTVSFSDVSETDTSLVSWEWDFGMENMSSDSSTVFTFDNDFTPPYTASLILIDALGCSDSTEISLSPDIPEASFSASDLEVCAGDGTNFIAQNQNYPSYEWDFGSDLTSDVAAPEVNFTQGGEYTVSLVVQNDAGCYDTLVVENYISVQDYPEVGFSTNVGGLENLCYPILIEFTDTSIAEVFSYLDWELDNGFAVDANTTVGTIYDEPGTYTVSLEVGTTFGCVGNYEEDFVIEGPVADFVLSTDEICLYDSITMEISDSTDVAYFTWEFGNGEDSSMTNPLTYPYNEIPESASTNIQLITWSADSVCSAATERPLQVNLTLAGFDRNNEIALEDTAHCFGLEDNFTNTSIGATGYKWELGNGYISTLEDIAYTYPQGGIYDVMLIARNDTTGCRDTLTKAIQVFPEMDVSAENGLTCEGDTLFLSAYGGNSFLWQPGEFLSDSLSQFPYLATEDNTELTVLITDTNDCTESVDLIAEYIRPAQTPAWTDTVINFGTTLDFGYDTQPYHMHNWFGSELLNCPTCPFESFLPDDDNIYGVSVTDELNCFVDTFYFNVTVLDDMLFFMPNAFTPNADGANDYFFPQIVRAKADGYEFMIFNRQGELVWETNDIEEKWTGNNDQNEHYTDAQMYIWRVRVQNLRSVFREFTGSVMLIR